MVAARLRRAQKDSTTGRMRVMSVTVAWCIEQLLNSEDKIEGWAMENYEENDEFAPLFGDEDDEEFAWVNAEDMHYAAQLGPNGETMPDFTWTQEQVDLHEQGWRWYPDRGMWWHSTERRWEQNPEIEHGG